LLNSVPWPKLLKLLVPQQPLLRLQVAQAYKLLLVLLVLRPIPPSSQTVEPSRKRSPKLALLLVLL